jgi:hypothetical protein
VSEHVASARFDRNWASHGEASARQFCTLPELPFSFQRPSDVTFPLLRAFLNHHLVLALGLLLTERSPSPTAEKPETEG